MSIKHCLQSAATTTTVRIAAVCVHGVRNREKKRIRRFHGHFASPLEALDLSSYARIDP
jgi:hypothetical protein